MNKMILTFSMFSFLIAQQSYACDKDASWAAGTAQGVIATGLGSVVIGLNAYSLYLRSQQDYSLNIEVPSILLSGFIILSYPVTYCAHKLCNCACVEDCDFDL